MNLLELFEAILDEDIVMRDASHLAAFAVTVAEAYDALPMVDQRVVPLWKAFSTQNEDFIGKIQKDGITIVHSATDPYGDQTDDPVMQIRYMLWDMVVNKKLIIYTGHSDDHPAFTPQQNVIFRTVHDYFAHGKLRSTFRDQIKAMGIDTRQPPTPEQLARILPTIQMSKGGNKGHLFNMRGEINAYLTHSKIVSPKSLPVLFTEIVGQVCYNVVVGDFPQQKVALLYGFDYRRVGAGDAAVEKRINDLRNAFRRVPTIQTSIKAKPVINVPELMQKISR